PRAKIISVMLGARETTRCGSSDRITCRPNWSVTCLAQAGEKVTATTIRKIINFKIVPQSLII
ncbi:MAG: hypothetical protein GAS50_11845, partial [Desulfobacterales bacterium]|nr:hypothetical protein [Desulfobacterales bacterium]